MTYFIFQTGIQSKNGSANLENQELICKGMLKIFGNKKGGLRLLPSNALLALNSTHVKCFHEGCCELTRLKTRVIHQLNVERNRRFDAFNHKFLKRSFHT